MHIKLYSGTDFTSDKRGGELSDLFYVKKKIKLFPVSYIYNEFTNHKIYIKMFFHTYLRVLLSDYTLIRRHLYIEKFNGIIKKKKLKMK